MTITTTSSNIISAQFTQNISDLRKELTRTAEEATTGRWSDLTAHLSGRIGTAMLSKQALDNLTLQRETLNIRAGRLDVAQLSLKTIQDRVQGIDVAMRAAIGIGSQTDQALAARNAEAALGVVFTSLNVRFGERYLFSGDATASQPLVPSSTLLSDLRQLADASATGADFQAALDTYFNTPGGTWQSSIYTGSANTSDPDAVTAVHPALTELIRGLAVMALAAPSTQPAVFTQEPGIVTLAAETTFTGLGSLTSLRSDIGVTQQRIEYQLKTLDIEETIYTSAFNALTARDQYEAASALKQLESSLEASYMLTSRLSSLSLLNYLR
ncbi:flagellin [Hyphomonas sp.]|uniref:flagellin n=1 Tax=Hyphomonas sp. TaxID=87 RepID=UPI00391BFC17